MVKWDYGEGFNIKIATNEDSRKILKDNILLSDALIKEGVFSFCFSNAYRTKEKIV